MKTKILKLFFLLAIFFALSNFARAAISFDSNGRWETTFNCPEWIQNNALSCDSLDLFGSWFTTMENKGSQITASANNPLGVGGGFRHWIGDYIQNAVNISNDNSGPIGPEFPSPQQELWIRWYLRFEEGMAWDDATYTGTKLYPYYHKLLYIYSAGTTQVIPGFVISDNMALTAQATSNYYQVATPSGSGDWNRINGGNTGDGEFHLYEVHIKMDTNQTDGVGEFWIDGALVASNYAVDWSDGDAFAKQGWEYIKIGNNQAWSHNNRAVYEDFDDIVIYNTTPPNLDTNGNPFIGPIGYGDMTPPSVPSNLSVL
ncbi:MAG: hypothetical protein HGA36_02910 [Candidatus Moranbacteria bacterium]|nr:hypothetical protein [Candidatus Moranbacteria bacterium]